jgi:single-strand DNA-binding protein
MIGLNSVSLVGRIATELKPILSKSGKTALSFELAVQSPVVAGGKYHTMFLKVSMFGDVADNTSKYCKKGVVIGVSGKINVRDFINHATGAKIRVYEIIATEASFLPSEPRYVDKQKIDLEDAPDDVDAFA